jgi:conjugal transfer pilus assembly protein TraW
MVTILNQISYALRYSFFIAFSLFVPISAEDLGVYGETFAIKELDLRDFIRARLLKLEGEGFLEKANEEIRRKAIERIKTPPHLEHIKHTEIARTFEFDPTIEITRDLADHNGRVFAKKGDRFNPLDKINMTKPLLFIDGEADNHIKWVISKLRDNKAAKVILVKGSPIELQKKLNRVIYFDQHGFITLKLGIIQAPAMAFQDSGKTVLTIKEEMAPQEEGDQ